MSDSPVEKEIVLNVDDVNEIPEEEKASEKNDSETKFVEKNPITSLTEEERTVIILNAKNGVEQPYYDVKFLKNGNYRIIRKKEIPQTVSQKVVRTSYQEPSAISKKESPIYYTDSQLFFEHIIELNNKVDKLMSKHKKLKRKYQTLQNDIYVDDSEDINETINETTNETTKEQGKLVQAPRVRVAKRGWRDQITFL